MAVSVAAALLKRDAVNSGSDSDGGGNSLGAPVLAGAPSALPAAFGASGVSSASGASGAWPWPRAPALEGVKSRKRPVLFAGRAGGGQGERLELTLAGRVAAAGLAANEVGSFLTALRRLGGCRSKAPQEAEAADPKQLGWEVSGNLHLRLGVVDSECELPAAVAINPHILVVTATVLRLKGEAWRAASTCPCALLVVLQSKYDEQEEWLQELQLEYTWRASALPAEAAGPSFLHGVLVRGPTSPELYPKPWLEELMEEQLAPLYLEEFAADLGNLRRTQRGYGVKLSLMVQEREDKQVPELLGFLAYKRWGAPAPGVSVCAVGVSSDHRGKGFGRVLMEVAEQEAAFAAEEVCPGAPGIVRFSSLPSSVGFYARLGYRRTGEAPEDSETAVEPEDDDECVPMERRCFPRQSVPAPEGPGSPLQPWSPRRSRHLEDGPTWSPVEEFLLPPAAA